MPDVKLKIKWGEVFLGVIFLSGGIISILIPASKLEGSSIATIMFGITGIMLGTTFVWEAIKGLRERRTEGQGLENTKRQ